MLFKVKRLAPITKSVRAEKKKTVVSTGVLGRFAEWRDENCATNETEKEQSMQ